MDEKKPSFIEQNLKYIMIVIGILALVVSYFLFYSPKQSDINDIQDEIDSLESRYEDLKAKEKKRDQYIKDTEEAKAKRDNYLSFFAKGNFTKRQIMDYDTLATTTQVTLSTISFGKEGNAYAFGTAEHDGKFDKKAETLPEIYTTSKEYSLEVVGTYDNVLEFIRQVTENTKRRTSINSVSFSFDSALNTITANIRVAEYCLNGTDPELFGEDGKNYTVVTIPVFATGVNNIFFTTLVSR